MSAPVFLAEGLSADRVTVAGPEGRHAAAVRRLRVGEAVHLVDGRGTRAVGVVVTVGRDTVTVDVTSRTTEPPPALRLVLVQALAKGDRGELAVELATELGVDEVLPWSAARCVTRWEGERGAKALARWRSTAREAAKQSRRAWVPPVGEAVTTGGLAGRAGTLLVLHEEAAEPLSAVALPDRGDLLLVVGPEGGVAPEELETLVAAGAVAARLGPTVLRTSTAGAAAVAVLSARTGRW